MTLNMNVLAGFLTGYIALLIFSLHIVSSHRRRRWINIPEYVRRNFIITGAFFLWRSVNLVSLSYVEAPAAGMANREAVMASIALSCLVTSITLWAWMTTMPEGGWSRLEWVRDMLRRPGNEVPVMVDPVDVAHAAGLQATAPGEGAEAVVREVSRRGGR